MFAPHARELCADFDVIRVQTLNVQAAANRKPMPADYSIEGEARALRRTLDVIGVTGRVDLVGSSLGAVVALHFAVLYPDRVRTLTLFEPPAFWILAEAEYDRDPVVREMRDLTRAMTPSTVPSDEQLRRFRCLLGRCPPGIPERTDSLRAEWDTSRWSMRGLAAVPAHREDRERLARLAVPVLMLNGSETVPFHRRMCDSLAAALPKVERAELPGGHGAPRTAPSEFVRRLREFLAQHE
jgi:pimeloyl-ACP methyl ester carboxylesterase